MFKYFLIIFYLLCLNNCTTPGTALLGPVFTGATTKSLAQASVSFGTNQVVRKIQESEIDCQCRCLSVCKWLHTLA